MNWNDVEDSGFGDDSRSIASATSAWNVAVMFYFTTLLLKHMPFPMPLCPLLSLLLGQLSYQLDLDLYLRMDQLRLK